MKAGISNGTPTSMHLQAGFNILQARFQFSLSSDFDWSYSSMTDVVKTRRWFFR